MLVLALVAGTWLMSSFRSVELEADGQALADQARSQPISAANLRHARDALQDAGHFTTDMSPQVTEAQLLANAGRRAQAASIALRVTDEEPENFGAWVVVYANSPDRTQSAQARRRVASLNPSLGDLLP